MKIISLIFVALLVFLVNADVGCEVRGCPHNLRCDIDGQCRGTPVYDKRQFFGCSYFDNPCPPGTVCSAGGVCKKQVKRVNGGTRSLMVNALEDCNGDCRPGQVCIDDRCITPKNPIFYCSVMLACPPGYYCSSGRCELGRDPKIPKKNHDKRQALMTVNAFGNCHIEGCSEFQFCGKDGQCHGSVVHDKRQFFGCSFFDNPCPPGTVCSAGGVCKKIKNRGEEGSRSLMANAFDGCQIGGCSEFQFCGKDGQCHGSTVHD